MRFVSGGLAKDEGVVYVLFGNGSRDRRILSAIAEKMDHGIALKEPSIPRQLGLDGLAQMLRICLEKTWVRTYVLVIDIEHLPQPLAPQNVRNAIGKVFSRYGVSIHDFRQLDTYAYVFTAVLGHREARAYLAINGLRSDGIEENLAKLIQIRYNIDVDPTSVDTWLRDNDKSDRELVEEANLDQLQQSFPGITIALREIERSLRHHLRREVANYIEKGG